ncbi:MAG: type II secretion system protein GspG [Planctomycetaceae bacterium]|nr:type II secretion system protein GspG [Planctomycetaceae bacterium]
MKKRTRTRSVRRGGFTLIEVLLVLAILGVIAAMVVPNLLGTQKKAYIKTTKQSISSLEAAANKYAVEHDGELPVSLQSLLQSEDPAIPPDLDEIPTDAWGTPLVYEYNPGDPKPIITSYGPNKQQGGGDDITNLDDDQNGSQQL